MKTAVVSAESAGAIERAAALLRDGAVVALPTETVYGLAADALNPDAVLKIFEAKERPRFDPLIVHVPDVAALQKVATIPEEIRRLVNSLLREFSPGPLTFLLPRREIISDVVTAGLETVAVRISAHPVFSAVLRGAGLALAAPSANRFGRISPTRAQDVADELGGRIPLIVDGGATEHGLESTIVGFRGGTIEVLRQGPITIEELQRFAPVRIAQRPTNVRAPGQLPSHYAPQTPLTLVATAPEFPMEEGRKFGLLAWNYQVAAEKFCVVRCLSKTQDLREAAANLFRFLRELDGAGLDHIVAENVPETGLGAAIMDRLRRAAMRGGRGRATE